MGAHLKNFKNLKAVVLNLSWFAAPFQSLSTLVAPGHQYGFAISRQSYLVNASARSPRKTAPWPLRGAESSG